eukprot:EG_transcript_12301
MGCQCTKVASQSCSDEGDCTTRVRAPSCWESALESDGSGGRPTARSTPTAPCPLGPPTRSTSLLFGDSLHRPPPEIQPLSALPWAVSAGDDTLCTSAEPAADESFASDSSDHSLRVLPPDSPNWLLPAGSQRHSPAKSGGNGEPAPANRFPPSTVPVFQPVICWTSC